MPKASERVEGRSRRDQKFLRQAYKLKFKLHKSAKMTRLIMTNPPINSTMYVSISNKSDGKLCYAF